MYFFSHVCMWEGACMCHSARMELIVGSWNPVQVLGFHPLSIFTHLSSFTTEHLHPLSYLTGSALFHFEQTRFHFSWVLPWFIYYGYVISSKHCRVQKISLYILLVCLWAVNGKYMWPGQSGGGEVCFSAKPLGFPAFYSSLCLFPN